MNDSVAIFAARVREAAAGKTPLCIRGGGSKDFYGGLPAGEILDTGTHAGIVAYDPTELVVTARCGTPLAELEAVLAEHGQMLAFEPPHFGTGATVGGAIAAGLSGPRRACAGAARDFVLGVELMDGQGRVLNFGGQVMKNVAGFDVSRLIAGSLGTLGLLLEVSLKVAPRPATEMTLRFEMPQAESLDRMNTWAGRPLPISATCWQDDILTLRLSGTRAGVAAACAQLGGESVENGPSFWQELREQRARFFTAGLPLWRLSLPSVTPPLDLPGAQLLEWGGGLRWLKSGTEFAPLRDLMNRYGGHATLFRCDASMRGAGVFHPLPAALMALHKRLKERFDPDAIFNPGRMYPEF